MTLKQIRHIDAAGLPQNLQQIFSLQEGGVVITACSQTCCQPLPLLTTEFQCSHTKVGRSEVVCRSVWFGSSVKTSPWSQLVPYRLLSGLPGDRGNQHCYNVFPSGVGLGGQGCGLQKDLKQLSPLKGTSRRQCLAATFLPTVTVGSWQDLFKPDDEIEDC